MLSAQPPPRTKMSMMPYSSVTGPPETTEMASVAETAAQLLQMFHPSATMARSPMSRFVWVFSPMRESSASSSLLVDPPVDKVNQLDIIWVHKNIYLPFSAASLSTTRAEGYSLTSDVGGDMFEFLMV